MIRIAALLCVLAVNAQAGNAVPRLSLSEEHISRSRPIPIRVAPYQVSIQILGHPYCGGSIISRYHALTAGHCILDGVNSADLVIHSRSNFFDKGDSHQVVQGFHHKYYSKAYLDYDVGVLKVVEPFTLIFNNRRPARIVDVGEVIADNAPVAASGWGTFGQKDGPLGKKLMGVELTVLNKETCAEAFSPSFLNITSRLMCAGSADETSDQDGCLADAGGPLVSKKSGKQVGIFLWGYKCVQDLKENPGVYADLTDKEIHDFISPFLEN